MMNKEEINRMIDDAEEFLHKLAYKTGVGYQYFGANTEEHNNLWARNANKAVTSWRNHLLNRLEDLNEE
jgi:hypothetical protein